MQWLPSKTFGLKINFILQIALANSFSYYLNSIYVFVNFNRNLWNFECRGTEEGGPNESLIKEISQSGNSNANVLRNDLDLFDAKTLRLLYSLNPLIDYPNINFLQNKKDELRVITKSSPLDIPSIDETKLDEVFLTISLK